MGAHSHFRNKLSPWSFLGGMVGALFLFLVIVFILYITKPQPKNIVRATAEFIVTPIQSTEIKETPSTASTNTPVLTNPPAPLPGEIQINAYVQISGTEGDGLRLRKLPNLESDVMFLAMESEVFTVVEGPIESIQYTWWYLKAPYDSTRQGWAVSNFLEIVQRPE